MLEVEVKIRTDLTECRRRLSELGFSEGTTVYERDTYYNGRSTDLPSEDKALRIREHRDLTKGETSYVLNFKGPRLDKVTMTREETQFEVPTFSHGDKVLRGLGFEPAGGVEKTRVHFQKEEIVCCLDKVTDLGDFLEVEILAEDEEGYRIAVGKIEALLSALGLKLAETLRDSYLTMLMKKEDIG